MVGLEQRARGVGEVSEGSRRVPLAQSQLLALLRLAREPGREADGRHLVFLSGGREVREPTDAPSPPGFEGLAQVHAERKPVALSLADLVRPGDPRRSGLAWSAWSLACCWLWRPT